jgi:hypothetical protein
MIAERKDLNPVWWLRESILRVVKPPDKGGQGTDDCRK